VERCSHAAREAGVPPVDQKHFEPMERMTSEFLSGTDVLRDCFREAQSPCTDKINGEPSYNFPEFVELLVTLALTKPPTCLAAPPAISSQQADRIRSVFQELFHLPPNAVCPASSWRVASIFVASSSDVTATNLLEIIDKQLPALPDVPKLRFDQPSGHTLPHGYDPATDRDNPNRKKWGEVTVLEKQAPPQPAVVPKWTTESLADVWQKVRRKWHAERESPECSCHQNGLWL
jgi:hypothetical protein